MNPEKQRILIAEHCGYKRCCYPQYVGRGENRKEHAMFSCNKYPELWMHKPGWGGPKDHGPESSPTSPPDYCNDLNAMHEAEKHLLKVKVEIFVENIREIVFDTEVSEEEFNFFLVHATAAQRAEAFLKTIGKWEE